MVSASSQWKFDEGQFLRVDGVDFAAYMKGLRGIDKDLYNEFRSELRAEAAAVREEMRDAWTVEEAQLQSKWKSKGPPIKKGRTSITSSVSSTRARVYSRSQSQKYLNAGKIRHPFFGDRARWYTTWETSATRWWDDEIRDQEPKVIEAFARVMREFTARVAAMKNASTSELSATRR